MGKMGVSDRRYINVKLRSGIVVNENRMLGGVMG